MLNEKRLKEILRDCVKNDLYNMGTDYVRETLVGVCGCTEDELRDLDLDGILNGGDDGADAGDKTV